ncbi:hypothetical protein DICVIV_13942, partial [Dictyocaulus viviparus]
MICLAYGCVYFYGPCYFIFARSSLEFTFSQNTCGDFLSHYIDFWMSIVILAIAIFLDFFTLVKLRMIISQGNTFLKYGSSHRFKKDVRFIIQTACTTLLFTITIICFHTISSLFTSRFSRFCTTTFVWGVNHTLAGAIVIVFNQEIRRNIYRPFRFHTTSSPVFLQN